MATDCTKWPNKGGCVGCHAVDLARNIPKASPPSKSPASNPPHPPSVPLTLRSPSASSASLFAPPPQHPSQLRHPTKPANRSRQNIATNPITYLQRPVLAHARPIIHLPIDRLCLPLPTPHPIPAITPNPRRLPLPRTSTKSTRPFLSSPLPILPHFHLLPPPPPPSNSQTSYRNHTPGTIHRPASSLTKQPKTVVSSPTKQSPRPSARAYSCHPPCPLTRHYTILHPSRTSLNPLKDTPSSLSAVADPMPIAVTKSVKTPVPGTFQTVIQTNNHPRQSPCPIEPQPASTHPPYAIKAPVRHQHQTLIPTPSSRQETPPGPKPNRD
jgi:hypothetical protein